MAKHYRLKIDGNEDFRTFTTRSAAQDYARDLAATCEVVEHETERPYEHYVALAIDQWRSPVGAVTGEPGEGLEDFLARLTREHPDVGFCVEKRVEYPVGSDVGMPVTRAV